MEKDKQWEHMLVSAGEFLVTHPLVSAYTR